MKKLYVLNLYKTEVDYNIHIRHELEYTYYFSTSRKAVMFAHKNFNKSKKRLYWEENTSKKWTTNIGIYWAELLEFDIDRKII